MTEIARPIRLASKAVLECPRGCEDLDERDIDRAMRKMRSRDRSDPTGRFHIERRNGCGRIVLREGDSTSRTRLPELKRASNRQAGVRFQTVSFASGNLRISKAFLSRVPKSSPVARCAACAASFFLYCKFISALSTSTRKAGTSTLTAA